MSGPHVDHRARTENIRWFVETGESASGAARRMGLSVDALERWCRTHDVESWRILRSREPGAPFRSERARSGAMARWSA